MMIQIKRLSLKKLNVPITMPFFLHKIMQWINRALLLGLAGYGLLAVLYVWQVQHDRPFDGRTADGIVILTGGAERVDTGLAYLQQGLAPRALVSGVHHDVKLRELMALHRIPKNLAGRIDLGFGAIDTAGNAQETARWVKNNAIHSLIVVTSNYHMPRALLHLRLLLPGKVALYPSSVTPDILQRADWYTQREAWQILFLAYNKYVLTWPEIILWRYKMRHTS